MNFKGNICFMTIREAATGRYTQKEWWGTLTPNMSIHTTAKIIPIGIVFRAKEVFYSSIWANISQDPSGAMPGHDPLSPARVKPAGGPFQGLHCIEPIRKESCPSLKVATWILSNWILAYLWSPLPITFRSPLAWLRKPPLASKCFRTRN